MYVVYFCGEYEFDENGYNIPKTRRYKTLEGAQKGSQGRGRSIVACQG